MANNDGRNGSGFLGGGLVNNNLDPATRPTVTASVLANNLSDDPATRELPWADQRPRRRSSTR